jgi:hypothetical protein
MDTALLSRIFGPGRGRGENNWYEYKYINMP